MRLCVERNVFCVIIKWLQNSDRRNKGLVMIDKNRPSFFYEILSMVRTRLLSTVHNTGIS
jgi:hypothetical protein